MTDSAHKTCQDTTDYSLLVVFVHNIEGWHVSAAICYIECAWNPFAKGMWQDTTTDMFSTLENKTVS